MGNWGSQMDTYTLEYAGGGTMMGNFFHDPAGDGVDDTIFLPDSVVVILERRGEEKGDIWIIDIPNWLAKDKGLI